VRADARLVYWTNDDSHPVITNLGQQALSDVVITPANPNTTQIMVSINISCCPRHARAKHLTFLTGKAQITNGINASNPRCRSCTLFATSQPYGWDSSITQQPILYFSDSNNHSWSLFAYSTEATPAQPTFQSLCIETKLLPRLTLTPRFTRASARRMHRPMSIRHRFPRRYVGGIKRICAKCYEGQVWSGQALPLGGVGRDHSATTPTEKRVTERKNPACVSRSPQLRSIDRLQSDAKATNDEEDRAAQDLSDRSHKAG